MLWSAGRSSAGTLESAMTRIQSRENGTSGEQGVNVQNKMGGNPGMSLWVKHISSSLQSSEETFLTLQDIRPFHPFPFIRIFLSVRPSSHISLKLKVK
jgi:hypothetical protein